MFCPQCGTRNDDGSKYCFKCGFALHAISDVLLSTAAEDELSDNLSSPEADANGGEAPISANESTDEQPGGASVEENDDRDGLVDAASTAIGMVPDQAENVVTDEAGAALCLEADNADTFSEPDEDEPESSGSFGRRLFGAIATTVVIVALWALAAPKLAGMKASLNATIQVSPFGTIDLGVLTDLFLPTALMSALPFAAVLVIAAFALVLARDIRSWLGLETSHAAAVALRVGAFAAVIASLLLMTHMQVSSMHHADERTAIFMDILAMVIVGIVILGITAIKYDERSNFAKIVKLAILAAVFPFWPILAGLLAVIFIGIGAVFAGLFAGAGQAASAIVGGVLVLILLPIILPLVLWMFAFLFRHL